MNPVSLTYLAVARVRGADAAAFLHGQLTADITALEDGDATFSCYCSPRGQVYATLLVCRTGSGFLLVGRQSLLDAVVQRLRMYVLRAEVDLALEPELAVYGLASDDQSTVPGADFLPVGSDLGYRIIAAAGGVDDASERWQVRELKRGIVWLGPETSERFIPQMLGLDALGAVSFSKGCYPGQEIIARAHYLGAVKRKPLLLRLQSSVQLPPGASLTMHDNGQMLEGTVIESGALRSAAGDDETVVLLVAPPAAGAMTRLEYEGRSYTCATM